MAEPEILKDLADIVRLNRTMLDVCLEIAHACGRQEVEAEIEAQYGTQFDEHFGLSFLHAQVDRTMDELTYRSYRHQRLLSPQTSPERWGLIFGEQAAEYEKRFLVEKAEA